MRRPLIAGNWKMFTEPSSALILADELKKKLGNFIYYTLIFEKPGFKAA